MTGSKRRQCNLSARSCCAELRAFVPRDGEWLFRASCHTGFIQAADAAPGRKACVVLGGKLSVLQTDGSRSARLFYGNCGIALVLMMVWMDPLVAAVGSAIAVGLIAADQRYARSTGRKGAVA
jgi:hypothetical protein